MKPGDFDRSPCPGERQRERERETDREPPKAANSSKPGGPYITSFTCSASRNVFLKSNCSHKGVGGVGSQFTSCDKNRKRSRSRSRSSSSSSSSSTSGSSSSSSSSSSNSNSAATATAAAALSIDVGLFWYDDDNTRS